MILGVGTDIIEISRIAGAATESFLKKYFTNEEIFRYQQMKNSAPSIAADFAAKEAVAKAIGTGFRGFSSNEIEIGRDELGRPFVCTYGRCADICRQKGIENFYISLSHCKEFAVAYTIAEGK